MRLWVCAADGWSASRHGPLAFRPCCPHPRHGPRWLHAPAAGPVKAPPGVASKAHAARAMAEQQTDRLVRVLNSSVRGGLRVGGLAAVFYAVQTLSGISRGARDFYNTAYGGMAAGAVFGASGAWLGGLLVPPGSCGLARCHRGVWQSVGESTPSAHQPSSVAKVVHVEDCADRASPCCSTAAASPRQIAHAPPPASQCTAGAQPCAYAAACWVRRSGHRWVCPLG